MTAPHRFQVLVEVTDYGPWNPENEAAASALLEVVNRQRTRGSERPRLERQRLDGGGWGLPWLMVDMGDGPTWLMPGEHLVVEAVEGVFCMWCAWSASEVQRLRMAQVKVALLP